MKNGQKVAVFTIEGKGKKWQQWVQQTTHREDSTLNQQDFSNSHINMKWTAFGEDKFPVSGCPFSRDSTQEVQELDRLNLRGAFSACASIIPYSSLLYRRLQAPGRWLCCLARTSSSLPRVFGVAGFWQKQQDWGTNQKAESSFLTHMPAFSYKFSIVLKSSSITSWP